MPLRPWLRLSVSQGDDGMATATHLISEAEQYAARCGLDISFQRTDDGVRLRGVFVSSGATATKFVPFDDLDAGAKTNPLVAAIHALQDRLLPPGVPRSRTHSIE